MSAQQKRHSTVRGALDAAISEQDARIAAVKQRVGKKWDSMTDSERARAQDKMLAEEKAKLREAKKRKKK